MLSRKSTRRAGSAGGRENAASHCATIAYVDSHVPAISPPDEKPPRLIWMLFANPDTSTTYVEVAPRGDSATWRSGCVQRCSHQTKSMSSLTLQIVASLARQSPSALLLALGAAAAATAQSRSRRGTRISRARSPPGRMPAATPDTASSNISGFKATPTPAMVASGCNSRPTAARASISPTMSAARGSSTNWRPACGSSRIGRACNWPPGSSCRERSIPAPASP